LVWGGPLVFRSFGYFLLHRDYKYISALHFLSLR
jgi:hypothetical protein